MFVHYIDIQQNAAGYGLQNYKRALLSVVLNKNYFGIKVQDESLQS